MYVRLRFPAGAAPAFASMSLRHVRVGLSFGPSAFCSRVLIAWALRRELREPLTSHRPSAQSQRLFLSAICRMTRTFADGSLAIYGTPSQSGLAPLHISYVAISCLAAVACRSWICAAVLTLIHSGFDGHHE